MKFNYGSDFFKGSFDPIDDGIEYADPIYDLEDEEDDEEQQFFYCDSFRKDFNIPVPTSEIVLKDKRIDLRLFCSLLLISNHFSVNKELKDDHRYLYDNKLQQLTPDLTKLLGITRKTFMANFKKLILSPANIVKPINQGTQYYKLYSKDENNKKYVLINNLTLETLVKNHRSLDIKVYCVLKFLLHHKKDRNITQQYIAETLGYSKNSRKMIAKSLERLQESKLIVIDSKFIKDRIWVGSTSNFATNIYTLNFYKIIS